MRGGRGDLKREVVMEGVMVMMEGDSVKMKGWMSDGSDDNDGTKTTSEW